MTVIAGPGVTGPATSSAQDFITHQQAWSHAQTASFTDCTESAYVTVDLGDYYPVTGVTVWHSTGQLAVTVSISGPFYTHVFQSSTQSLDQTAAPPPATCPDADYTATANYASTFTPGMEPVQTGVTLQGGAVVTAAGLVLDGAGQCAEIALPAAYGDDNTFTVSFWFQKQQCSAASTWWEYLYSHVEDPAVGVLDVNNTNINMYMGCVGNTGRSMAVYTDGNDRSASGTFLRTVLVDDAGSLGLIDLDLQQFGGFDATTTQWVHVVLKVGASSATHTIDGLAAADSAYAVYHHHSTYANSANNNVWPAPSAVNAPWTTFSTLTTLTLGAVSSVSDATFQQDRHFHSDIVGLIIFPDTLSDNDATCLFQQTELMIPPVIIGDCWLTQDEIEADQSDYGPQAFKDAFKQSLDSDGLIIDSISVDGDDIPGCVYSQQPDAIPVTFFYRFACEPECDERISGKFSDTAALLVTAQSLINNLNSIGTEAGYSNDIVQSTPEQLQQSFQETPPGRQYCNQKVATSTTGDFIGEEYVAYETGEGYGPPETPAGTEPFAGQSIPFAAPQIARFVRHWSGKSSVDNTVHFLEMDVQGVREPTFPDFPTTYECTYEWMLDKVDSCRAVDAGDSSTGGGGDGAFVWTNGRFVYYAGNSGVARMEVGGGSLSGTEQVTTNTQQSQLGFAMFADPTMGQK